MNLNSCFFSRSKQPLNFLLRLLILSYFSLKLIRNQLRIGLKCLAFCRFEELKPKLQSLYFEILSQRGEQSYFSTQSWDSRGENLDCSSSRIIRRSILHLQAVMNNLCFLSQIITNEYKSIAKNEIIM